MKKFIFAYLLDKLLSFATTLIVSVYIYLKFGLFWSLISLPVIFFFFIPLGGIIFALIIESIENLFKRILRK